jgi:hypothetical protein
MLKRLVTCPLGSTCEKIVGDEIHTCAWYMTIKGTDTQTGEQVDKQMCAMVAQPMLTMDITKATFGQVTALTNLAGKLDEKNDSGSTRLIGKS